MEEGTKTKKTVFIGGLAAEVTEQDIYNAFQTFGDILEVQLPSAPVFPSQPDSEIRHRGFAFVTFTSTGDAADAIDNMDGNELSGRVINVNIARPQKTPLVGMGNRAIWESEDWLRQHAKPLAQSGGVGARAAIRAAGGVILQESKEEKMEEDGEGEGES